jgi:hypothetical protein
VRKCKGRTLHQPTKVCLTELLIFGVLVCGIVLLLIGACDSEDVPELACLTSFGFLAEDNATLGEDIIAVIDEENLFVTAVMPYGTEVTELVATFTCTGVSVYADGSAQMSGDTSNDFLDGLLYTVIMADETFRDYFVALEIALNPAKDLTSFLFPSAQNSQFPTDHVTTTTGTNITSIVISGTDISALVAKFETSGVRVAINGVEQESGSTVNSFTPAVVYSVKAEDGTSKDYTVNVTVSSLAYGDTHEGGLLIYLNGRGGGLVAATSDTAYLDWNDSYVGGTGTDIGAGAANTEMIVSAFGEGTYAAKACYDLELNGYSDWFMPSIEELRLMYTKLHLAGLGEFREFSSRYSSSSEIGQFTYAHDFNTGQSYMYGYKWSSFSVHAARAF